MKSLTINTLVVAVALTLWGTASLAASELSGQSEKDTPSATVATSIVPLHALSRLDASTLADQEMTDQELKTVEGGLFDSVLLAWRLTREGYDITYWYPECPLCR
jgi:hypothetical protein